MILTYLADLGLLGLRIADGTFDDTLEMQRNIPLEHRQSLQDQTILLSATDLLFDEPLM